MNRNRDRGEHTQTHHKRLKEINADLLAAAGDALREIEMAAHLIGHAATDPLAWLDTAGQKLRAAIAKAEARV